MSSNAFIPPKLSQKWVFAIRRSHARRWTGALRDLGMLERIHTLAPLEQEHVVHMIAAAFDGDESDASRVAGRFKASPAVLGSFSGRDPSSTVWLAILLRRRPDEGGVGEGAPRRH